MDTRNRKMRPGLDTWKDYTPPHPLKFYNYGIMQRKNVRAELSFQGVQRCHFNIIPVRYYKYYIASKQELWKCPKSWTKMQHVTKHKKI